MNNITIALVDDHKLFRDGIASLINSFSAYTVILEADNGHDFIKRWSIPGCLISFYWI